MGSIPVAPTLLQWEKDRTQRRRFILKACTTEIGNLTFAGCGSLATGRTGARCWTFKREGSVHPSVTVRRSGSELAVAVLTVDATGGGILRVVGDSGIRVSHGGWIQNHLTIWAGQVECLRIEKSGGLSMVEILTPIETERMSLFVLLGWHVLVIAEENAAALAACTAAIVAVM